MAAMLTGPYEVIVIQIIPPVNYVLQKSPKPQPLVAHADKLKRCYSQLPEVQGVYPYLPMAQVPAQLSHDQFFWSTF